ncbi:MAG: response regulator [Acidobacteriaceae bacterium]|nr:response regulator [Acidobacteriaceae bacterium]
MTQPLRILVIDDDPVMRELLEALLGIAGYLVETVSSGEGALLRMDEGTAFEAILTDLHMPGIQGRELAARLLAVRPKGMVLLGMSGSFPTESEKELLDVFLQKPFTVEEFQAALESARQQLVASLRTPVERTSSAVVLDEAVFARLLATLPADALRSVYRLTLDDVRERLVRMDVAVATGDRAALHREAHSIKGGCGMVGAAELYQLAATTEEGTASDTSAIAEFAAACQRLERILDEKFPVSTK